MMRSLTTAAACILILSFGVQAYASDPPAPPKTHEGRGFMIGIGLGPSRTHYAGAEDRVLVVGGRTGTIPLLGGDSLEARTGEIVPRALVPANAEGVVPVPINQGGATLSLQVGWSFSPRLAVLLDVEANGGWNDSFNHVVGGPMVRYSPHSRLWVEAGFASGELNYGFANSVVKIPGAGKGFLVAAGVVLVTKPMWMLDLHLRSVPLWYDQFHTNSVSAELGIIRRRS